MLKTGTLYIISAPSGAGKSTLINAFLQNQPLYEAQFSVSHTTRQPRNAEQHGVHYYFVEKAEFERMIQDGELLEHAEVFGNFYGTSKKLIEDTLAAGVDVFLDIDWQGARQIREKMPDARSIYILPPSRNELLRRLKGRSQDSDEVIANRMAKALSEIEHYDEYDYVIVNDDFEQALTDFKTIMRSERLRLNRQQARNGQLINKLLYAE